MTVKPKLPEKRGISSLTAPSFHAGTVLEADQLNQIGENAQGMMRLMLRSLLGCGVLCGLKVQATEKCSKLHVTVACGVAVDCCGNLIEVPKPDELIVDLCGAEIPHPLWVVLRRYEKCCAPRTALCANDDDETTVCSEVRAGYEIRLLEDKPECACACEPMAAPRDDKQQGIVELSDTQQQATSAEQSLETEAASNRCLCADPLLECHHQHYLGECCCDCSASEGCCDCEWIVLARIENEGSAGKPAWIANHRHRRFIRPVLMRDPLGIVHAATP